MPLAVTRSTAVGAFVLGALALGVLAVLLFGGGGLFTGKLRVVVYFNGSVAGLTVGSPVTLRGVKVGAVQSMKVYLRLPELVPVIPVYLEIEPNVVSWSGGSLRVNDVDVEAAVKSGLRAQLSTQSLVTGQLSVNLDFNPDTPAILVGTVGDAPEIPSIPSDLQRFKDQIADLKLPELVDKARDTLTWINRIAGELDGKVGPMADSLRQTSDTARTTLETANDAIRHLQLDASNALGDIDRLAMSADQQVKTAGKEIEGVLTAADGTLTRANAVIASLNDLVVTRAPLRNDLEAAVRDLAASTASLRNFSRAIERDPSTLLLGRSSK
jgi:paraquat-inducible protein B